jgi:hypothetical protein
MTHLGCLETDHNPDEINFSSCFLLSFSDLHCDFSFHQPRTKRAIVSDRHGRREEKKGTYVNQLGSPTLIHQPKFLLRSNPLRRVLGELLLGLC